MSFLEEVASYLYGHYEDSLENFCLVFPNKRAGLFFSKYLAGKSQKPIWAPDFRSINELMLEKSGWQIADDLSLLFTLYGIYCKHTGEVISFEEFYSWGEVILSDFDDLDKYMVHAGDLYRNLSDLKQMDEMFDYLTREQKNLISSFWAQFQDDPKYKIKAKFSSVWPKLSLMYEDFRKNLSDTGCVYEGMAYRQCIQDLAGTGPEAFPAGKYIFIGFNALNACEIELFKYLKGKNKALFFWDYDDYYIQNLWHEAGFFMRDNLKRFPMPSDFRARTQGLSEAKTIRIHAVPSETGQTRVMNEMLSDPGNQEKDPVQTAVILPDEQVLLPVLQNLPDTIPEVNISMGYPLSSSPAGSLFEKLSLLQRKRVVRNAKIFFRHQELIDIFNHPYIKTITNFYPDPLTEKIRLQNQIWLTRDEIIGQTDPDSLEIMSILVRECTDGFSYVGWLSEICSLCLDTPEEESSPESICHREYLYVLLTALKRFEQIFSTAGFAVNIETCWKILRKNLKGLRVPFKGEPLNGLQIMGILETRAIDFDRIIILSMNEGIFPRAAVMASFIPYSLRKGFGLTTYEHQDAMFAYYFYRLLQRASEVDLIYNSASNEEGQSEKSRYLSQLQYENIFQPLIENKYAFEINIPERIAPSYTHNENTRSRLLRFCTPLAEGG
ncbi:MAG: hypothetical protein PHS48_07890, partial [Bacteroidales bacterium]|nr:hypothetical protein [Bacteroidales bacterium]